MDFSWTNEQKQIKEKTIRFAQQELQQALIDLDLQEKFNLPDWKKCCDFGILGLLVPQKYGGKGADILTTICALEGLGYGCKDNGLIFSINAHIWASEIPLVTFGTEEQKQKYLPKLCRGEWIGGHAASEPEAGSDVYSLKTKAERRGDQYILNGHKNWVTNGPIADLNIVFATVDPSKGKRGITAFLVEKSFPGFSVNRKISKMGLRTAQLGEIILQDCQVPLENRLGQEGAGMAIFNHSMEWERGFILASVIGTMERLVNNCTQYARKRNQFGQPIGKFQMVASKIVEMKLRLETSRNLLYKVAWLKKMGKTAVMEAAMAKLYISESWIQCCTNAVQVYGGYGYLTECEVERELRDAQGSAFFSGTSEIQRLIISELMGL